MNGEKIAVIGSGTMGSGIAHTFAQYNYEVFLVDKTDELLNKAISQISKNLDRQIQKGTVLESDKRTILSNIHNTSNINNLPKNISLIIEAIYEDKQNKIEVFTRLNELIDKNCIFASNTSSISITELGAKSRPELFIGMHFMNPVPIMKLVEIIRGHKTSDETVSSIKDITTKINKTPIEVNDYPGFISNRILMPMINEAIFALYEGVASAEAIDQIMKMGMNHPMGPLTLADFIGLDVCLSIMNVLYEGFNDPKYRPCPLLKKMVASGTLGRKTGEGFYKYWDSHNEYYVNYDNER